MLTIDCQFFTSRGRGLGSTSIHRLPTLISLFFARMLSSPS